MTELIRLSQKERGELAGILKLSNDARQYQRALALLLLDEGESVEEIAEKLLISRQSIYNWVNRFEQRYDLPPSQRILDAVRSGRPATVSGIIDPFIEKVINDDPRKYGYNSTIWTANLLSRYLKDKHNQQVSIRSIGKAISRLHINWKRPRHTLAR